MEQYLWSERYRPRTISECILPTQLKVTFQQFVDDQQVPNLLLTGTSGVGKTTVAKAMLEQLGCDYIVINGSLDRNIDTLRNDIQHFASSISFQHTGKRKYVILDEADFLNPTSTMPALRNFMEQFADNCGFILTANYPGRIIDALRSRCSEVEFTIPKAEKTEMAKQFLVRVTSILKENHVTFSSSAVSRIIVKYFPDWRRVLNELQRYSATGAIDEGILAETHCSSFKDLISLIKDKNFTAARKWIAENNLPPETVFRLFYDNAGKYFTTNSIPALIMICGKYQYQSAHVADQEINLAALIAEVMVTCQVRD
jgi:DNA polymerase III delta prime subunit